MNIKTKVAIICGVLICLAGALWMAQTRQPSSTTLTYSQFFEKVRTGQIAGVIVMGSNSGAIQAICRQKDGNTGRTVLPSDYRDALAAMQEKQVDIEIRDASSRPLQFATNAAPFLLLLAVWIVLLIFKLTGIDQRNELCAELSHNGEMVTLDALRAERREEILRLARRRGAHSLRVFGSVARGEANENSDLDLLVVWEPGRSLLDHAGLVEDLQQLLGIKVH